MIIRPYQDRDLQALLALYHHAIHQIGARYYTPEQLEAWSPSTGLNSQEWHQSLSSNFTYVAEDADQIIAFADMTATGVVNRLYIHPDYQGSGAARLLADRLISQALDLGLTELTFDASVILHRWMTLHGAETIRAYTKVHRGISFTNYEMRLKLDPQNKSLTRNRQRNATMHTHKDYVRQVFDAASSTYGTKGCQFFRHFGQSLVNRMASRMDSLADGRVLDIATGTGAVLLPLLEQVGTGGEVIGIDLSAQMLSQLSKTLSATDLSNITLIEMDAEQLDFEDNAFDAVTCGFALFFIPNQQQALREIHRVLKPGGTLAVSVWGRLPNIDKWLAQEAGTFGQLRELDASPFRDTAHLREVLEEAGFEHVAVDDEDQVFYHTSPEAWWDSLSSHGMLSCLEGLSPDDLEELKQRSLKHATSVADEHGVAENWQARFAVATKPLAQ